MYKYIHLFLFFSFSITVFSQEFPIDSNITEYWGVTNISKGGGNDKLPASTNNNCSSATILTVEGAESCLNTDQNSTEAGEGFCALLSSGASYETVWYKFQATSSSTTITLNMTSGATNCGTDMAVFGAYASSALATAACMPVAANQVAGCVLFSVYDPGFGMEIPTTVGLWYLITIQNQSCGGSGDRDYAGCIQLFETPVNNDLNGASGIDECGVVFNGTNIGYSPSNVLPGNEDLDNNIATTCATCSLGDDVPYVVNNDSWFLFCATSAGTWSVDFSGITNCYFNYGLQMTIFKGVSGGLTQIGNAPSPSNPGSSWTSSDFDVVAGECIYMLVDGFAGDQCDYSYTLNNVSGSCDLLPIKLTNFNAEYIKETNQVLLLWNTVTEINNESFTIERSADGLSFETVEMVAGAGNSNVLQAYQTIDKFPFIGTSYYRLIQTDFDGTKEVSDLVVVKIASNIENVMIFPNPVEKSAYLSFNSSVSSGVVDVAVYDVSGRLVINQQYQTEIGVNKLKLGSEKLPQGMYFLKLIGDDEQQGIKFIKE